MNKVIIIIGPTAVGKTSLSIELAKEYDTEIISADSMQIYEGFDIGTAKVTKEEASGIKHHLIDCISPDKYFSVSDFQNNAFRIINEIIGKGKIPIIVGGTGLYIHSLTYLLDFQQTKSNESIREKWNKRVDDEGLEKVYDYLRKIDPLSAERIDPTNRHRILRAIEIFEETGKKMSASYREDLKVNNDYDFRMIGLYTDRKILYERINQRVDLMFVEGLLEEVYNLSQKYNPSIHAFKAIGYREVIDYLYGLTTKKEMIHLLKRNSRRYAKRQLTWFKRDPRIQWFDLVENYRDNYKKIIEYINEK